MVTWLIDDDEIYLFSVKKVIELNRLCDNVQEFRNGRDAINFFVNHAQETNELPDVILVDINMPVMDGWEFIEAFREVRNKLAKQISLYVVSSSVSETDQERARSFSNVSDYLVKPITATQLKQIYSAAS